MSLFDAFMILIKNGKTDGLAAKAEKLCKGGKLTEEDCETLMARLAEVAME